MPAASGDNRVLGRSDRRFGFPDVIECPDFLAKPRSHDSKRLISGEKTVFIHFRITQFHPSNCDRHHIGDFAAYRTNIYILNTAYYY